MEELEREIQEALNANVDLSKEEYAEMSAKMDESTKANGVKGRAALTESVRHKRVQTNFYATALNILINIYQLTAELVDEVKELNNGKRGKNE